MATPPVLDFAQLLQPISDEQPSGAELKEDDRLRAAYQNVKDAREAARAAEKKIYQAAWLDDGESASLERPDWRKVFELATDVIATKSKDLWVAAWLIEALARLHGFPGLRDGFQLARELVEQYWDGIHPRPDEEGYATTVAQLTGLNGEDSEGALIAPIDHIPITAARSQRPLTSADYKHALELDKLDPEKRTQRIERGTPTLDVFQQAVRESGSEFYQEFMEDLQLAIDEFFRLGELLTERCGHSPDGYSAAPPTSAIRSALVDVRERVQSLAQELLGTDSGAAAELGSDAGAAGEPSGTSGGTGGKKGMTRDEAFRQLLQVADFFRRTEPHSPVSYALEQAVRWGRMSLPDLLSELIADDSTRDELFRRVGLPRHESP